MNDSRINICFSQLKKKKKPALITFLTAYDPSFSISLKLLKAMPEAGADIIEIGMPFSDPMADGPVIQRSYIRALKSGCSLVKTLKLVESFRATNNITPIVLMGYYNPILQMGLKKFINKAKASGVDGVLIVDLPPEVSDELSLELESSKIDMIRLASPTTTIKRMNSILKSASGFIYYVSITGVTGSKISKIQSIKKNYMYLKKVINLSLIHI